MNVSAWLAWCKGDDLCREQWARTPADPPSVGAPYVPYVIGSLYTLVCLLGLVGNFLVVTVLIANQQMRSTTNVLILNLAIADLLFILLCVPSTGTQQILETWPFGVFWCHAVQYLIVVTAYASVYTLVFMSFDRYLAVVHPVSSRSFRTERNAVRAAALLWVAILAASLPAYYCHDVHQESFDDDYEYCVFATNKCSIIAFQMSFFATSYVVPLALICGLYLCMLVRLWGGVAPGGRCSAESRRGKKRVTRMVLVVVAIFAICWCPIQVILVLKSIDQYEINNTSVMIQIVSHVLAYTNSCVNPILYAFLSENFRKAFRKVIYCGPGSRSAYHPGQQNGRPDHEKSALTKTTRTNDIL